MVEGLKRKSGGQPGNQNARKHGFYSQNLTEEEKLELESASDMDGLDQEMAILRVKFRALLTSSGMNFPLMIKIAEALARLYNAKNNNRRNDSTKIKEALTSVLEEFVVPGSQDSDPEP
jgi:hypothetical protein